MPVIEDVAPQQRRQSACRGRRYADGYVVSNDAILILEIYSGILVEVFRAASDAANFCKIA